MARALARACLLVAIKTQLMQNHRFLNAEGIRATPAHGPIKLVKISELNDIGNFLHLLLPHSNSNIYVTKWLELNGYKIKRNSVLVQFNENEPDFHLVQTILISDDSFKLVVKKLHDCFFIKHLQAYKVFSDDCYSYIILENTDVDYSLLVTTINKIVDGYNYIPKNWM